MQEMVTPPDIRAERGQTLIELLVVIFMMGLLLTGITAIFVSSMRTQTQLSNEFTAVQNLHGAVDKLLQDANLSCSSTATSGATASTITLSDPPCDGTNNITWCTSGSGTSYSLYRYTSGSTCTSGRLEASYLTGGSIFTYYAANYNAGSYELPSIHLNVTVNVTPATSSTGYQLVDDVALRNAAR